MNYIDKSDENFLSTLAEKICYVITPDCDLPIVVRHLYGNTYQIFGGKQEICFDDILLVKEAPVTVRELFEKEFPQEKTYKNFPFKIKGYYISGASKILYCSGTSAYPHTKNIWPTEKLAEAALALSELFQWYSLIVDLNKPKPTGWFIKAIEGKLDKCQYVGWSEPLFIFDTKNECEMFLKDHRTLLEIAKPLIS